jgi:phospholipid-transporting ATPase
MKQPASPSLDQLTSDHLALIIDGDTLLKILGDEDSKALLLTLARICKSVIACRVSPEQKRLMVRLVKRGIHPRPVTLAIGDGANDVAMIQEAQIGVGISGKEGRQAVNSSDFAIAQFRFLKRLMLVHGRSDYRRTCKVVLYSFYKNIVLTMIVFGFTFYSGFSGQSMFDDYVHSAYNLILAWPVIAFGAFDRDVSDETLEKYHILYVSGRAGLDLNLRVMALEIIQAIVDAIIGESCEAILI